MRCLLSNGHEMWSVEMLAMLPSRSCSQRPRCDSSSRIGGFTFAIVPSRATSVSLSPR